MLKNSKGRDLSPLFSVLEYEDLETAFEDTKHFLHDLEKSLKWKREKAEEDLYSTYNKKYKKYTALKTVQKLIVQSAKTKVIDYHVPGLYPRTELLRLLFEAELRRFNKKKLTYRTDFKTANRLYFPYLYRQGVFKGYFFRVDMPACFYSLYSVLGLDCKILADIDHDRKFIKVRASGQGVIRKDTSNLIRLVENYKELRNALYGITRFCFVLFFYPDGKIERRYIRTSLQNMDLLVSIASMLHDLVSRFRPYILYWNIDGGIVTPEGYEKINQFLQEHNLSLRIEAEGEEVEVRGVGIYRIGDYQTIPYEWGKKSGIPAKEYVYRVENAKTLWDWFKRK